MALFRRIFKFYTPRLDCALVIAPVWGVQNPPIGLAYIKSMLVNSGYKVKCFDYNIILYHFLKDTKLWDINYPDIFHETSRYDEASKRYGHIIDKWVKEILETKPRLLGFSIFNSTAVMSLILANRIKEINRKIIIFGGGQELSEKYKTKEELGIYLERGFDYLITRNNGEVAVFADSILKKNNSLEDIPGIIYRTKCGLIKNNQNLSNRKNTLLNLIPDYSDFDMSLYTNNDSLPVNFSYGCTNKCTFCIDPHLWEYYSCKKGEQVFKEIEYYISKYPLIRNFQFTDSLINGNHKELEKFCDLVIKSGHKFSWSAKARFDKKLTRDLLIKIRKSGCTNLDFGLESGSQKVLDDMNKNINLNEVRRILKDCKNVGLGTYCFIMIGYPTESEEDFQKTLDFIKENKEYISEVGHTTCCYIVKPSKLYEEKEKYGIIGSSTGWKNDMVTPEIRKIRANKLKELVKELYGVEHRVQVH